MTEIIRRPEFEKAIKKIKDSKTKERVKKQIKKIIESPEHGDFIKYEKNERKIYIPPFRLLCTEMLAKTSYFSMRMSISGILKIHCQKKTPSNQHL